MECIIINILYIEMTLLLITVITGNINYIPQNAF